MSSTTLTINSLSPREGGRQDTPEYALWTAVLDTYIQDARRCRTEPRCERLRTELYTAWIFKVCNLIDVDYEWFTEGIEKVMQNAMAGKVIYRKHKGGRRKNVDLPADHPLLTPT